MEETADLLNKYPFYMFIIGIFIYAYFFSKLYRYFNKKDFEDIEKKIIKIKEMKEEEGIKKNKSIESISKNIRDSAIKEIELFEDNVYFILVIYSSYPFYNVYRGVYSINDIVIVLMAFLLIPLLILSHFRHTKIVDSIIKSIEKDIAREEEREKAEKEKSVRIEKERKEKEIKEKKAEEERIKAEKIKEKEERAFEDIKEKEKKLSKRESVLMFSHEINREDPQYSIELKEVKKKLVEIRAKIQEETKKREPKFEVTYEMKKMNESKKRVEELRKLLDSI